MGLIEAITKRARDSINATKYREPHTTVLTPSGAIGDVVSTNIPRGTVKVSTIRQDEVFPGHDVTGIVLPDDIFREVNNENIFKRH